VKNGFAEAVVARSEWCGSTEYALLAALVAVGIIGGASTLGSKIGTLFTNVGNKVDVAVP